jgi:hypothetical protein
MSEHKTNHRALINASLPSFPPVGRGISIQFGLRVLPKANIALVEPDGHRTVDGKEEIRQREGDGWVPVPEGVKLHELGEPLPIEACDLHVVLVCQYANLASGGKNPPVGVHAMPFEVGKVDMASFTEVCEKSLPGGGLIVFPTTH